MLPLDQLSQMVKVHLGLSDSAKENFISSKWIIAKSPLSGRGLFATEDIKTGDVLYVDRPLIYGPRNGNSIQHGCTVCNKLDCEEFLKCPKCALMLCSERCQNSGLHKDDCDVISRWPKKIPGEEIDKSVMSRSLAPIRSLLLSNNQKQFMSALQAHVLPQHGWEVRKLQEYFEIPEEEKDTMILACRALDTNAYQIATPYGKSEMSLRGLYPVAGLMNHNCTPNTRYSFNSDLQMVIKAVKAIQAGSELFSCYSGLLWGTPARRAHLYKTKHFFCKCDRCADPTERGTFLAALKCFATECPGSLLPVDPLKTTSAWRCLQCGLQVPNSNICAIQSALGSLMGTLNFDNVDELENFLLNRVIKFIPKTNQIIVDLQCRLIWSLGDTDGLLWHELPECRLVLKETLCRSTLRTLEALGTGDATLRGLLLYHLHAALAERARRLPRLCDELKAEIEITIEQAYAILRDDISAPPDLALRHQYLGPGCTKPQQERFFILDV